MTRVLIVDDEVIFRNALKELLDECDGFEVCGEASDGLEAKYAVEKLVPEIVITDIMMPGVDGLSLIRFLHETYPDVQVIALSGYDDFEYVRTSMKNGAVDYLIKHDVNRGILLGVLNTALARIKTGRETRQENARIREQLELGQKALTRRFLLDLLEGRITDRTEISASIEKLGLPIDAGDALTVVLEIDDLNTWRQKYTQREWQRIMEQITVMISELLSGGSCCALSTQENRAAVLFTMGKQRSMLAFYNRVSEYIQLIRTALKRHYNMTACYSMSATVPIESIGQAYAKACTLLNDRLYRANDAVLQETQFTKREKKSFSLNQETERELVRLLTAGDEAAALAELESVFDSVRESGMDAPSVHMLTAQLLNLLNRALREYGMDIAAVRPRYHDVYSRIQLMSLIEIKQWICECYSEALVAITRTGTNSGCREATRAAQAFINKNYTRGISLGDIAEAAEVSPAYLSHVFKEDTGRGIVEHVNELRIEYAKKLIDEGEKLNLLYESAGFNSNTYFSTIFKQLTGMTPKQYKVSRIKSQEERK